MNFKKIEEKWQKRWEEAKIFEAEPSEKKKFYITVAYPYPSGGMHVGHLRTYTVPDVIARFKRMQGYNVLFPMAWHVTGTPIIGALKRLKAREKKQLYVLKEVYHMTDSELESIEKPMDFARYFIDNHYKIGMRSLGLSIDWRREFTTNDEHYSKFIEWQYLTLKKMGLIKKGLHPVKWCVNDKNPVTTHDLLEGEDADINEFILVKFQLDENVYIPTATLRPETVYGVTNLWINPNSTLVEAEVDGEKWIVSEECAEKLSHQNRKVEIKKRLPASELIGKKAKNPVLKNSVLILPAEFVNPDNATGMVMSVPSHAPFDYIALKDLRENQEEIKKWKLPENKLESIKPIHIIDTQGLPENPAIALVEDAGIKNQRDREKIEELTKEVYKKEFHQGVLNSKCGEYAGMKVSQAKKILVRDFTERGIFDEMLDFSERVRCRCGGKVVVAKKSSWFLRYGDEGWKDKVMSLLKSVRIIPPYMKSEYKSAIEWLEDWPCIRNFGLGTRLPWDKDFIIEPLSDSTIYMAYYTVSHILKRFRPEQILPEVFDYVFLGKGDVNEISTRTGIPKDELKKMKEMFDYWYPLDWRCSAHELVQNHLSFFLFHHAAIFPKEKHPKGIATWGIGLLEGGKMSSSKGNVVLAKDAIEKHGADTVRFFLMSSVEPWQDFDWREREVENYRRKLVNFYEKVISVMQNSGECEERFADLWRMSKMNRIIKETTEALENFQTRKAALSCFFEMEEALKWYLRRVEKPNKNHALEFIETWLKLMTPYTPHICEELWQILGKKDFISLSEWPQAKEELIDDRIEKMEELVMQTLKDIYEIIKIVGKKPKEIRIYTSPEWKHTVYSEIIKMEGKTPKEIIPHIMKSPTGKQYGKEALKFAQRLISNLAGLGEILTAEEEYSILKDAEEFFAREFRCDVKVMRAVESESEKASRAEPGKPGIEIISE